VENKMIKTKLTEMPGMFDGDLKEGELEKWYVSGMISDILSAAGVIQSIIKEYYEVIGRLTK
jgi:enoyl-[acyl-carrier protein] reductase II